MRHEEEDEFGALMSAARQGGGAVWFFSDGPGEVVFQRVVGLLLLLCLAWPQNPSRSAPGDRASRQ